MSICGRYWMGKRLGAGSFGEVFEGVDLVTGEKIAIKREPLNCKSPSLEEEAKLIKMLAGGSLIPLVLWTGTHGAYRCMVMNLLGPNLWEVLRKNGGTFSLKTVCNIAIRLICRIEYMHQRHLVHRDLKPENIMVGLSRGYYIAPSVDFDMCVRYEIYVCDLGLARVFKHADGRHKHDTHRKVGFCGTARYASLNAHYERAQTRRDDLESLGYMLVEFMKGQLPWHSLGGTTTEEKWGRIFDCKLATPLEVLCHGLPKQFLQYLEYCRSLEFKQKPNYTYLRDLFEEILHEHGMKLDREYDWLAKGSKVRKFVVNSPRRVPGVAIALDRKPPPFPVCKPVVAEVPVPIVAAPNPSPPRVEVRSISLRIDENAAPRKAVVGKRAVTRVKKAAKKPLQDQQQAKVGVDLDSSEEMSVLLVTRPNPPRHPPPPHKQPIPINSDILILESPPPPPHSPPRSGNEENMTVSPMPKRKRGRKQIKDNIEWVEEAPKKKIVRNKKLAIVTATPAEPLRMRLRSGRAY